MATTTNLNSLVINYLTQAQYDEAAANNTLNENQLYLTPSGITAADISNWNSKSDTDEKVKQTPLNGVNSYRGLLFGSDGGSEVTNTVYTTNKIQWNDIDSALALVIYNGDRTKNATIKYNTLWLADSGSNYTGRLYTNTLSETRSYYLPNKTGTIALTSDIKDQIFIATYNTTSYSDVLAAYNAGKTIICKEVFSSANTYYSYLERYENNTAFYFASPLDTNSNNQLIVTYTLNSNNTWSTNNIGMKSSSTQLIRWTEV